MKDFAVIENGKVVNVMVADDDYAATHGLVELTSGAGIDWDYANGVFTDNRVKQEVVTPPAPTKEELLAQLNALSAQIQSLT